MSSLLETPPSPVSPAVPGEEPKPPRSYAGWLALIAVLLISGGIWLAVGRMQEQAAARKAPPARTAQVRHGTIEVTTRVSGTTTARNSAIVVAPRLRSPDSGRAMSLIKLAGNGTMAAGILPPTADNLAKWIRNSSDFKPGSLMPAHATATLNDQDLQALVAYLQSLK